MKSDFPTRDRQMEEGVVVASWSTWSNNEELGFEFAFSDGRI
jgi:hypothetical protein